MSTSKSLSVLTFWMPLWILLASCSKPSHQADGKSVFRGSLTDDIQSIDPAIAYDVQSMTIVSNIYETLYHYDYSSPTFKIKPLLAADYPKFSKDEKTMTIPIRKGMKFHGFDRELVAQDFIYAWKRIALPEVESQGFWIFDGKVKGMTEFQKKLTSVQGAERKKAFEEPISGLRALDDHTLQVQFEKPYPQFLYVLTMTFTVPLPREAIEKFGNEKGALIDHEAGTGPFQLAEWKRGHRITLKRFASYPEKPALEEASFEIIKEEQPAWLRFLSGDLDLMSIPKDQFKTAITDHMGVTPDLQKKGIELHIEGGVRFFNLTFNLKDPVLGKNKLLRQAISSAIPRDEYIELFTNKRGVKAVNVLPPGIPDRPDSQLKYDYNIARAKELLKKAGFPNGEGLPPLKLDMRGADSVNRQMGDFFALKLSAIGIKLEIILNTFPAYLEKAKRSNFQISYGGWAMDYPDAENSFQLLYGPNLAPGPNDANFNNPEMNQLYEKMSLMRSSAERRKIIARMDEIFQEEVPWAMLYYHTDFRLSRRWLENYRGGGEMILDGLRYYRINTELRSKRSS